MGHEKGQKVCLWHEVVDQDAGIVRVIKEVIVTLTDVKTGTPGEFSRTPMSGQSLRGIGDDGKLYEKHWNEWPESQTDDFMDRWSVRTDGEGDNSFWAPREATYAHNRLIDRNLNHGATHGIFYRVDTKGEPILPKGDVIHCEKHDQYDYPGSKCFRCFLEERAAKKAVA